MSYWKEILFFSFFVLILVIYYYLPVGGRQSQEEIKIKGGLSGSFGRFAKDGKRLKAMWKEGVCPH